MAKFAPTPLKLVVTPLNVASDYTYGCDNEAASGERFRELPRVRSYRQSPRRAKAWYYHFIGAYRIPNRGTALLPR